MTQNGLFMKITCHSREDLRSRGFTMKISVERIYTKFNHFNGENHNNT